MEEAVAFIARSRVAERQASEAGNSSLAARVHSAAAVLEKQLAVVKKRRAAEATARCAPPWLRV